MQMAVPVSVSTTSFHAAFYPHLVPKGHSVNKDGFGTLSIKPGPLPCIGFVIMEHNIAMHVKASHCEGGRVPLELGTSQNTPLMLWKHVVRETPLLGGPGPCCPCVCVLSTENSEGQVICSIDLINKQSSNSPAVMHRTFATNVHSTPEV